MQKFGRMKGEALTRLIYVQGLKMYKDVPSN